MQVASGMPVLAAASVQTETQGNEPGRLPRPLKRREDCEADRHKPQHESEDGEPSPGRTTDEEVSKGIEASAEENESPAHELDVRL